MEKVALLEGQLLGVGRSVALECTDDLLRGHNRRERLAECGEDGAGDRHGRLVWVLMEGAAKGPHCRRCCRRRGGVVVVVVVLQCPTVLEVGGVLCR